MLSVNYSKRFRYETLATIFKVKFTIRFRYKMVNFIADTAFNKALI